MKRFFVMMTLVAMALQIVVVRISTAVAASAGSVVINEIAWMGTGDNSNDEWIELYNTTNQSIDLAGWLIEDDGSSNYEIAGGTIAPKGYFLIEDVEMAIENASAGAVIGLSLANAGDTLTLKDAAGDVIDVVNGGGGAWYAGNATSKASMERIDPGILVDSADNWASAISGNGSVGRTGTEILGTPGSANSNYGGSGPEISFSPQDIAAMPGETVTVSIVVANVVDLYAYGLEIDYDPEILTFVGAADGNFLDADGSNTAFNASLENSVEGTVLVGNARMVNPPAGIDGSGTLFELTFEVTETAEENSTLSFGGGSFLSDSFGDLVSKFNNAEVMVNEGSSVSISNLTANEGTERYSLQLAWNGEGATSYIVKRKGPDGNFAQLAVVTDTYYLDDLDLIPTVTYEYQVVPVNGGNQSSPVNVSGSDDRGIIGDNDRSDRVDGRDIERLARAYGSGYGDEEYDALVDTNYDGIIDGSDLIDVGINFGFTY